VAYTVIEKRTGWRAEYPDNVRNREWEYQAFKADKTPNTANLTARFNCHKPLGAAADYLFSYDRLKNASRWCRGSEVRPTSQLDSKRTSGWGHDTRAFPT
jgi:hypothetical protein